MPDPQGSPAGLFWALGLLAPLSILLSALSALLERSGPIRLRHWAEGAGGPMRRLYDAPVHFGVFRSLLALASRIAPVALFLLLAALLTRFHRAFAAGWSLVAIFLFLVVAEIVNRLLVGHDPERALASLTYPYRFALFLLSPLVTVLSPLIPARATRREEDEESEASDEEIEAFIDVGTREGILEPEQGRWLSNIVEFVDTQARSVMTPRIDMICAPVTATLDTLAERFVDSGHSRIPLYQDSIDHIVGILHIRDLLRAQRSSSPPFPKDLVKPPLFIPETKPLGELLRELQERFQQVAIVVDEYGGTAGLVTVEDLLEEIVGEIMDEHDALAAELVPVSEGVWQLDGRAHIELLDDLFDTEIPEGEYETVAGLIFTALGHVPLVGETVDHAGLRFTVEAVADRRIQTVRVERTPLPVQIEEPG